MRAAAYLRVSTLVQDPELQAREIDRLVQARGWKPERTYRDVGQSGAHVRRPALEELRRDAARRRFDVVVVWDLSRLARSTLHALELLRELDDAGVRLVTVRQDFDTETPLGRALFTLAAMFAEFERQILIERVRAGMERARADGKRFGRPRREVDTARLLKLREEKHSIRAIGRLLGIPASTVAQRLAEATRGNSSRGEVVT